MREFLGKDPLGILGQKAKWLDDLYGDEIWRYECLRENPEDKTHKMQLRRTKRYIMRAKPAFWRAVKFALEHRLINQKPASYRDMLPRKIAET